MTTRYVFITGGGVSSLGKGLASAALGSLLIGRGFNVRCRKFDPYLNVDPGTMNPDEHGECFVTEDGAETDLDLGHYERFTGVNARKTDSVSQGMIYRDILDAERRGDYLGSTVQVFPHVINRIMECFSRDITNEDIVLCEIGGAVGDIESAPFVEAVRQFIRKNPGSCCLIHLAFMPYIRGAGELKTKPVQHAVKDMQRMGIQPDILLVRSEYAMPDKARDKISMFTDIPAGRIISGVDADSMQEVPGLYFRAGLDRAVMEVLNAPMPAFGRRYEPKSLPEMHGRGIRIALIGKYSVRDAYISVHEAVRHAGMALGAEAVAEFVHADAGTELEEYDGIIVPGGFGVRGVEGKLKAIQYAREHGVPFLGICYGMQLAAIEYARNVAGVRAWSTEFEDYDPDEHLPLVCLMTEWEKDGVKAVRTADTGKGGSMRLGAYEAEINPHTVLHKLYSTRFKTVVDGRAITVSERHRHRWEVNPHHVGILRKVGMRVSAMHGNLPEALELPELPFFVAVQYHPEFKSRVHDPHPLFKGLVETASRMKGVIE